MRRHSRRKIKQEAQPEPDVLADPFHNFEGGRLELFLSRLFYWLRMRIRHVLLAVATVFFILLLSVAYFAWHEERNEKSLISLAELLEEPSMNVEAGSPEIAIEKLDEFAKRFSHKRSRMRLMLQKKAYLEKAKKHQVLASLNIQIASQMETPELRAYFYLRAAILLEHLREYKKAEDSYGKVVNAIKSENTLKARALLGQGRMLGKLGRIEEARKIFRQILSAEDSQVNEFHTPAIVHLLQLEN